MHLACRLLVLGVGIICLAEPIRYDNWVALDVTPKNEEQLTNLTALSLTSEDWKWWNEPSVVDRTCTMIVSRDALSWMVDFLKTQSLTFEVIEENIQALFDVTLDGVKRWKETKDFSDWDTEYHDYPDTVAWLQELTANYSSICRLVPVGLSYQTRTIYAVEIYGLNGPDPNQPGIFFDAAIHAREWITPATVEYVLQRLLEGYGVDAEVTNLVDRLQWTIIPIFNVDGYQYTLEVDQRWRKTRSPNANSACIGTDANRNTPLEWGGVGSSTDPCSDTYRGDGIYSEAEVLAVSRFLQSKPNTRSYVNWHANGYSLLEPWAFTPVPPPDVDRIRNASIRMQQAMLPVNNAFYIVGDWYTELYPSSGIMADWAYGELGIVYSWTFELRGGSFWPPAEFIVESGAEFWAGVQELGRIIIEEYA